MTDPRWPLGSLLRILGAVMGTVALCATFALLEGSWLGGWLVALFILMTVGYLVADLVRAFQRNSWHGLFTTLAWPTGIGIALTIGSLLDRITLGAWTWLLVGLAIFGWLLMSSRRAFRKRDVDAAL